ncbi:MAG: hypothetical protein GX318_02155 [Clostridia bacterium]|nr:hypothetical protein [Clostridia bacterium]
MDSETNNEFRQEVPPATEIDCIETNKVFDECLVRQCIYPIDVTGVEVPPNCVEDVTCSDFTMEVAAPIVPTRRITDPPGFVRVSFPFTAAFDLTVTGGNCETQVVSVPLPPQTISNVRLYCPEPLSQILTQQGVEAPPAAVPNETIKLEFVGTCIDVDFAANPEDPTLTDFILAVGYYLVIKCEQVVQIQVLSRGYCAAPECTSPSTNPCDDFDSLPVPPFFPAQLPFEE